MNTVRFISYKISSGIDLKKVATFFGLSTSRSWENCIILDEQQLAEVYKYKLPSKKIYIFEFGCIAFENFHTDETNKFLKYLQLIIGNLDYKALARYRESLAINISEDHSVSLWKGSARTFPYSDGLAGIIAVALAKSVALSKIESDVDLLLDEAETFLMILSENKKPVTKLQSGTFNTDTRKFASIMAHILRFEYDSAVGIRIFDRPSVTNRDLTLRGAYDELASYYELEDRYDVLEKKANELRKIARSYSVLRYWRQEGRLLLFEIFLLVLFPLSYIVHDQLRQNGIEHVLKIFVN